MSSTAESGCSDGAVSSDDGAYGEREASAAREKAAWWETVELNLSWKPEVTPSGQGRALAD